MVNTLDKGPIRFFEKYIIEYDKRYNLEVIAIQFLKRNKWIANKGIDNEYIGNAKNQQFFSGKSYPLIIYLIYNSKLDI